MTNYDPNNPDVVFYKLLMVVVVSVAFVLAVSIGAWHANDYLTTKTAMESGLEQQVIPGNWNNNQATIWVKPK